MADFDSGTQGPRPCDITDEAGHYRLRTDNGDDGAAAGKYRIVIHYAKAINKQLLRRFRQPQQTAATQRLSPEIAKHLEEQMKAPRVPSNYGNFNETLLRVEVHPGPQTLDFDLP